MCEPLQTGQSLYTKFCLLPLVWYRQLCSKQINKYLLSMTCHSSLYFYCNYNIYIWRFIAHNWCCIIICIHRFSAIFRLIPCTHNRHRNSYNVKHYYVWYIGIFILCCSKCIISIEYVNLLTRFSILLFSAKPTWHKKEKETMNNISK